VCIRAYSRPDHLRIAISGALAQTFDDLEVVVSDDSGRLGAVAESFGDRRVRYRANPSPAGPAANLRTAIGLSRGRLLALLDEDDRWEPAFLATTVPRLRADPELGVVFTRATWDTAGRRTAVPAIEPEGTQGQLLGAILTLGIPASSALVRRAVWDQDERLKSLAPDMVGDLTLWLAAAQAGWRFHRVDEPLTVLRRHRDQVSWTPGLADRLIATLAAFRFDDPQAEEPRRTQLALAHLRRAGLRARRGRPRLARQDLRAARAATPRPLGVRALLAFTGAREAAKRWGAGRPRMLACSEWAWSRVRPPLIPGARP
jgi:glycosyltransferase involved in cell wall biosynthesis